MSQENETLRAQVEMMERQFSQTHGEFYQANQEKLVLDSEMNQFRSRNEQEVEMIEKEVQMI